MHRKSSPKADRVVRHTLADGSVREYRYPAYKAKRAPKRGETLGDLIEAWQTSPEWDALAPSTKAGYGRQAARLLGMKHVEVKRIRRREMIEQRNAVAKALGSGAASHFVAVASAMFGWAVDNDWIETSPMHRVKELKGGTLPAWTAAEADWAVREVCEEARRAIILARYTGQRRGDLIALPWTAYTGTHIRLTQQKTTTPLVIPVHPALKEELDAWRRTTNATLILTGPSGLPWSGGNLSTLIARELRLIPGFPEHRNIHGLGKLAAASLADAGCTIHEIAAITGHKSLEMLKLYTASADQKRLAEAAIVRLASGRPQTHTNRRRAKE